ncbi:MAG: DNA polymerase/3'-5' exonuclease PolX [Saprospiraceae bacterium]|nr:DNA polymerase/3'-5' exonuclease PolX [Saprospiraceae bacterium]
MTNKDIAGLFHELANLMELHDENPFKTRTYENAYLALRKMDVPLLEMDPSEWAQIKGIGTAIREKLEELKSKNTFQAIEEFRQKTPEGVRQMLRIKGLGPKKVKSIWKELNIESIGELAYACEENRLIELKGFGKKIQEDVLNNIAFFDSQASFYLYPKLETEAADLICELEKLNPGIKIEVCGGLRRALPVLDKIELLLQGEIGQIPDRLKHQEKEKYFWKEHIPVEIYECTRSEYYYQLALHTGGSESFISDIISKLENKDADSESDLFHRNKIAYVPPECRDLDVFAQLNDSELIGDQDIKGVIHTHTTYSDGIYSIAQMADECIRLGYEYLVISDHSRAAFYANGLSIERVEQQWREIDDLNSRMKSEFRIYKSIESDILNDGSLDYPDDILAKFDLVIASVHSQLKMDETKAMSRLIKAIENPYTRILGHMTGRLLLSRPGYPVDHKKIIEACAANRVCIELNANPMRLDLDWKWIPYAMEKEVQISINPDAHNLKGIGDIKYGVLAARKGGLLKNKCLNSRSVAEFSLWINEKNNF